MYCFVRITLSGYLLSFPYLSFVLVFFKPGRVTYECETLLFFCRQGCFSTFYFSIDVLFYNTVMYNSTMNDFLRFENASRWSNTGPKNFFVWLTNSCYGLFDYVSLNISQCTYNFFNKNILISVSIADRIVSMSKSRT